MNRTDYLRPREALPTEVAGKVTGVMLLSMHYEARTFVCNGDGQVLVERKSLVKYVGDFNK